MNNIKTVLSSALLFCSTPLFAQDWQWTRDDLYLNPSGLGFEDAAIWAWGDWVRDGLVDVLIRQPFNPPGDGLLHFYHATGSSAPPYWVEAPGFLAGFPQPISDTAVTLADLDGDGAPNLVTLEQKAYNQWIVLNWNRRFSGAWKADTSEFCECELSYNGWMTVAPFFKDADGDLDLDAVVESPVQLNQIGVRYIENIGSAHEPMWREDSSALALVYRNPAGRETFSPVFMHADDDSLVDLVVGYYITGMSGVIYLSRPEGFFGNEMEWRL